MLAALLIMVLAATFALVVVGAVGSLQAVERSDAAGWRAEVAAGRAVAAATRAIRWRPGASSGALEGQELSARESWRVSWAPAPRVAGDVWPRLRVSVSAASGGARRADELTMELRAEPWVTGVTCRGDAEIQAPLEVAGSGVYVGGCLRGRENVGFVGGPSSVTPIGDPADCARGDVFPAAAVHGGPGIFAGGIEIHDPAGGGLYAYDTDDDAGEAAAGSSGSRRRRPSSSRPRRRSRRLRAMRSPEPASAWTGSVFRLEPMLTVARVSSCPPWTR